jgi:hypothetical protein
MANPAGGITDHEITPQGVGTIQQLVDNNSPIQSDKDESDASISDSIHVIPRNTAILGTTPKAVGANTNILDPIRAIPKAVGASTNILDLIQAIPKAVGASTNILDLIQAIPKAVGATNKEEMTDQASSRSGVPRRRRGRLKLTYCHSSASERLQNCCRTFISNKWLQNVHFRHLQPP